MGFASFVVLAGMRTGSNLLEAHLNALPGVTCHGETFNPGFVGKLRRHEAFGITLAARDADPVRLLRALQAQPGLNGFRYFSDHDPRIRPAVMEDATCAKIVLSRHPLDSYLSWKIARATGQWKLTDPARRQEAKAVFDAREFAAFLDRHRRTQAEILRDLQLRGQSAFWIGYDDLGDLDVVNGLAAFLGVEARLGSLDPGLVKQNPGAPKEKVENPAEMAAALAGMDWLDLDHGPDFEPRRGAAVPSYLASGRLLYLPVPGGPATDMCRWMETSGPVTEGLSQRSLRQWRSANPGHRSFSILWHPLSRAWATFAGPVLGGVMPEIRRVFSRSFGLDLPAPEDVDTVDADALRHAFLTWLRFVKMAFSGQAAVRVDGAMATQVVVLQGFAAQQGPDVLLREARLVEGLKFLAAETGMALPPAPVLSPDPRLLRLADAEVRAAARDAYQRDYAAFGFDD